MSGNRQRREGNERELYRLTLAQFDFKVAGAAAERLCGGGDNLYVALAGGSGTTDHYWVLWTALAVSYARPFTTGRVGRLSQRRFERFEDEIQASDHRFLLDARKKLFAHNDLTVIRRVKVFPPGAWGQSPGSAEVERAVFTEGAAKRMYALCGLQRDRARERIAVLVEQLYGDENWEEGTLLDLDYPT